MESSPVAPKSKGKGGPPPPDIGTKGKGYGKTPLPKVVQSSQGQRTTEDLASALSKVKLKAVPPKLVQIETASTTPTCEMQSEDFDYQHKFRKMEYRLERLEMNSSEREAIEKLMAAASNSSSPKEPPAYTGRRRRILIDTDIGTDSDDLLALLTVIGMPQEDVEVLGITTCYHPTLLRKKVTEKLLNAAGGSWPQVKVCAGCSHVCGSHRPIFLKGNEGEGLQLTEAEFVAGWQITDGEDAIESMYQAVKKHPREVAIVGIGMATNIALCARKHPDFESLVGHIWLMMGGSPVSQKGLHLPHWQVKDGMGASELAPFSFPKDQDEGIAWLREPGRPVTLFPNHNSSGDSLATSILLTLRCPISVIPHWITGQHYLEGPSLEGLLALGAPEEWVGKQDWLQSASERYHEVEGSALVRTAGRVFYEWISRRDGQQGQCLHDPLTIYEAVYDHREVPADQVAADARSQAILAGGVPSLEYISGTFVGHEWAGFLTFIPDPSGPHRIAWQTHDANAWMSWAERTLHSHLP